MSLKLLGSGSIQGLVSGGLPADTITPDNLSQPMTLGTYSALSGTYYDYYDIPSWANEVIIPFVALSTNGTSSVRLQLGSSAIETTGYESTATVMGVANGTSTGGFDRYQTAAADVSNGVFHLYHVGSNQWVCIGQYAFAAGGNPGWISGRKTLGSPLTFIRFTTVGGTDSFDGGGFNVIYR